MLNLIRLKKKLIFIHIRLDQMQGLAWKKIYIEDHLQWSRQMLHKWRKSTYLFNFNSKKFNLIPYSYLHSCQIIMSMVNTWQTVTQINTDSIIKNIKTHAISIGMANY